MINNRRLRAFSQQVIQNKQSLESCSESQVAGSLVVRFRNGFLEQFGFYISKEDGFICSCILFVWHRSRLGCDSILVYVDVIETFTAQLLSHTTKVPLANVRYILLLSI